VGKADRNMATTRPYKTANTFLPFALQLNFAQQVTTASAKKATTQSPLIAIAETRMGSLKWLPVSSVLFWSKPKL